MAGGVRKRQGKSPEEEKQVVEKKGPVVVEGAVKKKDGTGIARGSNHEFAPPRVADEEEAESVAFIFHASSLHMMGLAFFGLIATRFSKSTFGSGEFLGISDETWFTTSLVIPALHQITTWIVMRGQMCFGILTKYLGTKHDLNIWRHLFTWFLVMRVVTFLGTAIANRNTMITENWKGDPSVTPTLVRVLGGTALLPALYTLHSVVSFCNYEQLIGGDHFRERIRRLPRVTEGAFQLTSAAIYLFGSMAFWGVAGLANSRAAFGSAMYSHCSIGMHYLCTVLPDAKMLYGSMADVKNGGNVTNLKNPQRATRN